MSEFELVWDARCGVAESPVWDAANRRLLFCDINGKRIQRAVGRHRRAGNVGFSRGRRQLRPVPVRPAGGGAAASCRAVRSATGELIRPDAEDRGTGDQPAERRQGRAGWRVLGRQHGRELAAPEDRRAVSRHRGRPDHQAEQVAMRYRMVWPGRLTARIMYHSDSTAGIIEAWDFDPATGGAAVIGCWRRLTNDDGRPDGAATDTDGNYWSAGPSAGASTASARRANCCANGRFRCLVRRCPASPGRGLYVTSLREGKSAAVLGRISDAGRTVPGAGAGGGRTGRSVRGLVRSAILRL